MVHRFYPPLELDEGHFGGAEQLEGARQPRLAESEIIVGHTADRAAVEPFKAICDDAGVPLPPAG